MNPNEQQDPSAMSLPQPQQTVALPPAVGSVPMQPLPVPGRAPGAMQQPVAQQPAPPPLQPSVTPAAPEAATESVASTDEEWVARAKEVIARTQSDPFSQTEELYKLRTQFMQQMHGRELKQKDGK